MRQPGGGSAKLNTVTCGGKLTRTRVVGRSRSVGTRTMNSTASPAGTDVGRTSTWAVATPAHASQAATAAEAMSALTRARCR